jgi:hypothetical protein
MFVDVIPGRKYSERNLEIPCCASPRNDGLKRIASRTLAMTLDERTRLFDNRIGNLR